MRRLLGQRPLVVWATLGVLAALVAGYFAFHALFVKVGRSVERPFSGPAQRDRYYVLQRYLEQRGLEVRTVRSWPQPLSHDTLVLWFANDAVPADLRSWTAKGGQLWSFQDPDADADADGWEPTPWPGEEQADEAEEQADEAEEQANEAEEQASEAEEQASEAEEQTDDAKEQTDDAKGQTDEAEEQADQAPDSDEPDEELSEDWCAEGCLLAAQFRYGAGCLTLVDDFGLGNEQVFLGETPARIDALLSCLRRPASILVVTSAGSPWFGQLLVQHAREALLAFAALLVLALWRAGKHLGPRLPPRKRERRQLLDHIGAVGTLAGRTGSASMLAAARRELRARLFRRAPHAASLGGERLIAALAETTGLTPSEVQRALLDEPGPDRQAALAVARAIQALWRKT